MTEEEVLEKIEEFYSKPFNFSYSSLSKLMFSPPVFHELYIMGNKPERMETHLIQGSLIHCLLLEPETFTTKYIISPSTLPAGNMKTVIDFVHYQAKERLESDPYLTLDDFKYDILDTLKEMNYHQTLKLDSARLDKVLTLENRNYFEFLCTKGNKILIDEETLKFCNDSVQTIRENPQVSELLGLDDDLNPDVEIFTEKYISMNSERYPFGLHGYIDRIKIDHKAKTINICDFKTSGKGLAQFKDAVEFYDYWMQTIIYSTLVIEEFGHLLEKDYKLNFYFVVIDKYFNTYAFPVSTDTFKTWTERFKQVLDKAEYHYKKREYILPYDFANNLIVL